MAVREWTVCKNLPVFGAEHSKIKKETTSHGETATYYIRVPIFVESLLLLRVKSIVLTIIAVTPLRSPFSLMISGSLGKSCASPKRARIRHLYSFIIPTPISLAPGKLQTFSEFFVIVQEKTCIRDGISWRRGIFKGERNPLKLLDNDLHARAGALAFVFLFLR